MGQAKHENQQSMIYFQNLVPGVQKSPLIDDFKHSILGDSEEVDNSERSQLLNHFPPVLSFADQQQKKKFYDDEAAQCRQFCCGGMKPSQAAGESAKLQPIDHYMLSTGSGTLFEGSAASIKTEMQTAVHQESFGSERQSQLINGLNQFNAIVSEREQMTSDNENQMSQSKDTAPNPFQTTPKPSAE